MMQYCSTICRLATVVVIALHASLASAQQAEAIDVESEQQSAAAATRHEAARLVFRSAGGEQPLHASLESVLKWSNPDVGRVYGDVYLWTRDGRPLVAASIFQWFHPYQSLTIELSSLSERPLQAHYDDALAWDARTRGVTWRNLPGDAPAGSRALRLIQMKRAASRFEANLIDERTDARGVDRVLRPLATPLYRYPADSAATDGALFGFVVGTDPELLLLLEAEEEGWRYAIARLNRDALEVTLDGTAVESFPHLERPERFSTDQPYVLINVTVGSDSDAGQIESASGASP